MRPCLLCHLLVMQSLAFCAWGSSGVSSLADGGQLATSSTRNLTPGVFTIRWSADGRYLATDFGVISLDKQAAVSDELKDTQAGHRRRLDRKFYGCDWQPGTSAFVSSMVFTSGKYRQDLVKFTAIDKSTPQSVITRNLKLQSACPSFDRSGNRIAFCAEDGVHVCKSDGSDVRRVLPGEKPATESPKWSPAGDKLLATIGRYQGRSPATFVVDITAHTQTELITASRFRIKQSVDEMSWSPLGDSVAIACYREMTVDGGCLILHNFSDQSDTLLYKMPADQSLDFASYSPDGKQIAFVANLKSLLIVDVASHKARTIYRPERGSDLWSANPTWSRDGRWIALWSYYIAPDSDSSGFDLHRVSTTGKPIVENL